MGSYNYGVCSEHVIPPLVSPNHCVDGGVLEPKVLVVHHTFRYFGDNESIDDTPLTQYSNQGPTRKVGGKTK